jgi:SHS2 domain-containing protein
MIFLMKQYGYFEHDADIGIIGRGATPEAAFESAAAAMFAIMAEGVEEPWEAEIAFGFEEEDLEFALVAWLNGLIARAQAEGVVLGKFELKREGSRWSAKAWGRPWTKETVRGVEVKGATLTMLSVKESDGLWEARCIVDV